ncbi:hypothetical protein [Horticoccus sp. 23ND18S-11]|uniref:hypothetical protein n=1 Tax=Horticoccus sp. 23ND18S-11 TaxID=3391832 RepID=UPI0039C97658
MKLSEERIHLRALPATRYPESDEICVRFSSYLVESEVNESLRCRAEPPLEESVPMLSH